MTISQASTTKRQANATLDGAELVSLNVTKRILSLLRPIEGKDRFLRAERKVIRAIRIYELYVGLYYGSVVRDVSDTGGFLVINMPETSFRQAQLFAAISLLEYFRKQKAAAGVNPPIRALSSPGFFVTLEWFLKHNGFRRLRDLPDAKIFEACLRESRIHANSVARLLDLSLRIDLSTITKRQRPGITMAKTILAEGELTEGGNNRFLGNKRGAATLGRRWERFKHMSIFHLIRYRNVFPQPSSLTKKNFAEVLLSLADDCQRWRQFAADYQAVWAALRLRHYEDLPSLGLSAGIVLPEPVLLPLPALPSNVREAVRNYGTLGRRRLIKTMA